LKQSHKIVQVNTEKCSGYTHFVDFEVERLIMSVACSIPTRCLGCQVTSNLRCDDINCI